MHLGMTPGVRDGWNQGRKEGKILKMVKKEIMNNIVLRMERN
jgi:hypothetical protein